jgi:hypothetical protein
MQKGLYGHYGPKRRVTEAEKEEIYAAADAHEAAREAAREA